MDPSLADGHREVFNSTFEELISVMDVMYLDMYSLHESQELYYGTTLVNNLQYRTPNQVFDIRESLM